MSKPRDPSMPRAQRWCSRCNATTEHAQHQGGSHGVYPGWRCMPCERAKSRRYYERKKNR